MNYNFPEKQYSLLEKIYLYFHKKVFENRLKKQIYLDDKFIISIGNITTGGTGKTPLTIFLADYFLKLNKKVLICLRGYKGSFKGDLLVSDKGKIFTTPYISGDEPYLIAFKLIEKQHTNFKVACGKKRQNLIEKYGKDCDIILLDDAFQNPLIARNKDIVLIDVNDNPDNIKLIPIGKYREPIEALLRADIIVLTRIKENQENLKKWEAIINKLNKAYFKSEHIKEDIIPPLKDKNVILISGIGNPDSFIKAVEKENINIIKKYIYKDHHSFTNLEIQNWLKHKKPILLTEKDWVRLLYNPIYLQNKSYFYRFVITIKIYSLNQFIEQIYS